MLKDFFRYLPLWCTVVFLCFSSLSSLCNGDTASTSLGSRYKADPDIPYWLWQEELEHDGAIARVIAAFATLRSWDEIYDWYGASTTTDNVYTAAFGQGCMYAITWYIGHGDAIRVWNWAGWIWYYELQYFIVDDSGNYVYDKDIYLHTECQNTKFAMIWSCEQANTIGGTQFWSGTPYGMPYAWLHTTDLSSDGYANPDGKGYVFIAWKGGAPALIADFEGADKAGFNFLSHFYAHAFYGHNINDALDYASYQVWGVSFEQSIFYEGYTVKDKLCQMKVYGDGGHMLPFNG